MDKDTPIDSLVFTYTDRPSLEGFSITVPAGYYSRSQLIDMFRFEYQWQCDEAPKRTIEIPLRKRYDTKP